MGVHVPAESVGRLTNMHIDDDHKNNPKLLVLSRTETSFEFTTIDCEAPPIDKGLTPTRRPLPQFEDYTPCYIHILTSFHGLVCLGIIKHTYNDGYSDLILWNPLTNEYKRLSKTNSRKECIGIQHSGFGLYYSSCEDDYKLVFVNFSDDNVYIYSLKSDSWRIVDLFQNRGIVNGQLFKGTYLNENLYYLQLDWNHQLSSIIRFNTKTERLAKIEIPSVCDIDYGNTQYDYSATIMVKSDCIHVCVKYDIDIRCDIYSGFERTTCIKLWKLDEYGNMKDVVTYQLKARDYNHIRLSSLIPFHLLKNGSWLMRNCYSYKKKIYKVDLKKKKHIKGKEKGNIYDDFEYAKVRVDGKNIVDVAAGRYIETFVSPNRYI